MEIRTRNVCTAFATLVRIFQTRELGGDVVPWETHGRPAPVVGKSPRGLPTLMVDEPVTILYERPLERVLFNAARDANPFFHLYHSLWLLAGRDDVAAPAYYARRYAEFSDDGVTSNGSYGKRWVYSRAGDQISRVIAHLKAKPESRRAVLQMWNVEDDLLKVDMSRDVCCNLSALFSVREETHSQDSGGTTPWGEPVDVPVKKKSLDMTVLNRSNDLVWGTLGEDFCTFSFLLEYVAAHLGVEVGRYWQVSNNLHVYDSNFKPDEWLAWEETAYRRVYDYAECDGSPGYPRMRTVPLVRDPAAFDRQLPLVVSHFDGREENGSIGCDEITEPFLWDVARPLLRAFSMHRRGRTEDAIELVRDQCAADDWCLAAEGWLERRWK